LSPSPKLPSLSSPLRNTQTGGWLASRRRSDLINLNVH
jgi:hypothetical protein